MKRSAGLLLYRTSPAGLEVLIGHLGGPFWAGKEAGAWSIPKGEYEAGEDPRAVARREFTEELGSPPPEGEWIDLGSVRQSSEKVITIYALPGDFAAETAVSNEFELEWPKGTGVIRRFPEIDRAAWFDLATARTKLVRGQAVVLDRLMAAVPRV